MRLETRDAPSATMLWVAPLLAAGASVVLAGLLFAMMRVNPIAALRLLYLAPLATSNGLAELALKMTPLLLCALGIAIGVRANVWNIGAEGQFTMGAIAGGGIALALGPDGGWYVLPLVLLAGIFGGMAWAAIAASLRVWANAHEILTTLMLNYVAQSILSWLVHGPWRDPQGFNFPQSPTFDDAAMLPTLWGTRLTPIFFVALLAAPCAWLLLRHTSAGYRLRVAGLAPAAARYAGFSANGTVWLSLLISGGLAGLAGIAEVTGPIGQLMPTISPGYGYAAIIVAFLGRLEPFGIVVASALMALLYLGADGLQMHMQLPLSLTGTLQGMLLFLLLAADVLVANRVVWRRG
jgi:general nucleoside transport system permease protein